MEKIYIQDVNIANAVLKEVFQELDRYFALGGSRCVGFANANTINLARNDRNFRDAINRFDLILPDGIGLAMAARMKGVKIKENLNGTDLWPELFKFFKAREKTLFLLGGAEGIAQKMQNVLQKSGKDIVVGVSHGYKTAERDPDLCSVIRRLNPDVVLVGMGSPIQERWVDVHREMLGKRLFITVGGLFNFVSGQVPRAPLWIRKMNMEWLFRIYCEPHRLWKRYFLGGPEFLYYSLVETFKNATGLKRNC